jgi:superfamily I DNA and/or RNA helicase
MKTKWMLLTSALTALSGHVLAAEPTTATSESRPRVEVIYVNPENFTDFTDSVDRTGRGAESYRANFKEYLEKEAERVIPEGTRLTISITEVDMAGDFEPWRGPQFSDIRIVKDLYPPRVNFTYKLSDAAGAVLREGEKRLRDVNFQMRSMSSISNDSLRYEKELMDDWLRTEFPKAKKAKRKT